MSGSRIRISLAAAFALAAIAVVAGCGGSASSSASGGTAGASVVPASALAYVAVDTDLSSSQWQTVNGLLDKFPSKDKLLTQLRTSFENDTKVSWENDVKPALGKELDVAVFGSKPDYVLLTQPADKSKFDALVKKLDASSGGSPTVTADVSGWTVLADDQASLTAFQQASSGAKLADDSTFTDAMSKLSDQALVKAYANGPKITQALASAASGSAPSILTSLKSGVAELVAEDNGLKLDGTIESSSSQTPTAYTPKLIDHVPSGALVYLSFRGSGSLQLPAVPMLGAGFSSIIGKLGTILANEDALYVLPGTPIPEVTLVATPADPQAAVTQIGGFLKLAGAKLGKPDSSGIAAANFSRFSVYYGVVSGDVVASDSRQGLADFQSGGTSLTSDPTYKEAISASGMPSKTTGFLYVNLKDALPLVESLAQLGGTTIPSEVTDNLAPLRTLTVYGTGKPGEIGFTAFLEVK